MAQITKTEHLDRDGEGYAEFYADDDSFRSVTVFVHRSFSQPEPVASVNWSGIGSVTPEYALTYAELINAAATFAAEYNAIGSEA